MFPIYVALHPLFAAIVHDYKGSYKALAKAKFNHIDKHVSVVKHVDLIRFGFKKNMLFKNLINP